MAWTSYQVFLSIVLVVTGSINTLTTKWADRLDSVGSDGKERKFEHPFVQASAMFLGELMCLLVFKALFLHFRRRQDGSVDRIELLKGSRTFSPLVLFIPAMCDMVATSIMYVGLTLTYASSFQMLRGSVIVFTGILSVGFLDRRLRSKEWFGIALVIVGLAIVGLSDFVSHSGDDTRGRNEIITGDLLIICAQVITAVQMVVEEKYVAGLDIPPLQAVGWEGFFGFIVLGLLQIPFYYIKVGAPFNNNAHKVIEDLPDAFVQISNNYQLVLALIGTIVSIAFFNFAGISVTKEISATTRMVLDSIRTLVIWMVALMLRWQAFHWPQIFGFTALVIGMCLYNSVPLYPSRETLRQSLVKLRSYYRLSSDVDANVENREAEVPASEAVA